VAGEVLMSISKDERERAIFRNRRIALSDLESNRLTAEHNLRIAVAEGKADERLAIAKKLLTRNRPIDEIMEDTGLTRAEIEKLATEI
jgi:hypothetical protein